MKENHFSFLYQVFDSEIELAETDYNLLQTAHKAALVAYAPYSGFLVGAAALLLNEQIVTGSNQENASYPAGLCAERSLMASAAQQYPGYWHCHNGNHLPQYPRRKQHSSIAVRLLSTGFVRV